jgi:putative two-component system response regulator
MNVITRPQPSIVEIDSDQPAHLRASVSDCLPQVRALLVDVGLPASIRAIALKSAGTVLVVDDVPASLHGLRQLLEAHGYSVLVAQDGEEAVEIALRERPDIVLTDVRMPKKDGFEVCRELRSRETTRLTPVILVTGAAETNDKIRAIDAGASEFLSKPIDISELRVRVRSLVQLKRYTDDLDSAEAVLRSLALTIEARDAYTEGHCKRLANYAVALGQRLELPDEDLLTLERGGYFHDIGKIGIPDAVLLKRGKLTKAERQIMTQHPVIGERLCGDLRVLHNVRPIVRHHHERLDGSGYPDGLSGDGIPLVAQIIGIVDVYDAITTNRPNRPRRSREVAFEELLDEVKRGWRRRDLVEAFIAQRRERPMPWELEPAAPGPSVKRARSTKRRKSSRASL